MPGCAEVLERPPRTGRFFYVSMPFCKGITIVEVLPWPYPIANPSIVPVIGPIQTEREASRLMSRSTSSFNMIIGATILRIITISQHTDYQLHASRKGSIALLSPRVSKIAVTGFSLYGVVRATNLSVVMSFLAICAPPPGKNDAVLSVEEPHSSVFAFSLSNR